MTDDTDTTTDEATTDEPEPTTAPTADPTPPPAGYPFPTWQEDGPFHVPRGWRPAYADAEPYPPMEAGYWQSGVSMTTTRPAQDDDMDDRNAPVRPGDAVVDSGNGDLLLVSSRNLRGPLDYPEWLHLQRLDVAALRARADRAQGPVRPPPSCVACGRTGALVRVPSILTGLGRDTPPVCEWCVPVAIAEARRRAPVRDGDTTRGQAIAAMLDRLAAGG